MCIIFAAMKKMAAIFFVSLYLFGATDAYQLLKLPAFITHYITHRRENPAIDLADFIQIHYQDQIVIDDDFQQDMQLPFKAVDCAYAASVALIPAQVTAVTEPVVFTTLTYSALKNNNIPSSHSADIWQPPKIS